MVWLALAKDQRSIFQSFAPLRTHILFSTHIKILSPNVEAGEARRGTRYLTWPTSYIFFSTYIKISGNMEAGKAEGIPEARLGQIHILFSSYIKVFLPQSGSWRGPKASWTGPDVAKSIYYFPHMLKFLAPIWKLERPQRPPGRGPLWPKAYIIFHIY